MDYIAQFGFHWFWLGVATLLLIIEVIDGRFMFLAASVAAALVGSLGALYTGIVFEMPVQVMFFVVLSASFVWLSRSFMRERMGKIAQQQDILKNRRYVGQVMTLVNPIENGHSSLNVDGMVWNLRGEDCPAGSQVKVIDMGEGWLKVEAL